MTRQFQIDEESQICDNLMSIFILWTLVKINFNEGTETEKAHEVISKYSHDIHLTSRSALKWIHKIILHGMNLAIIIFSFELEAFRKSKPGKKQKH